MENFWPKHAFYLAMLSLTMIGLAGCVRAEHVILIQTRVSTPTASFDLPKSPTPWVITATPEPSPTATDVAFVPSPTPLPVVNLGFVVGASGSDDTDSMHYFVADQLGTLSNTEVRPIGVASNQELADMLCAEVIDVAWLSTPGYLLAHEACGVEAVFRGIRQGSSWHRGEIVVQHDVHRVAADKSSIQSLYDLEGASIAYTTNESTSGYLLPRLLLENLSIEPAETVFWGGDRQAVLAVYRGEADAAACYHLPLRADGSPGDARALLAESLPDVYGKLRVLALTDPIPNDPLVVRAEMDPGIRSRLMAGLAELAGSTQGRDLLWALYGLDGLEPTADEDYDIVRDLGESLELDWATLAD